MLTSLNVRKLLYIIYVKAHFIMFRLFKLLYKYHFRETKVCINLRVRSGTSPIFPTKSAQRLHADILRKLIKISRVSLQRLP